MPLTATACDIAEVHVNGVQVAADGIHSRLRDPAKLFEEFFADSPGSLRQRTNKLGGILFRNGAFDCGKRGRDIRVIRGPVAD